MASAIALVRQFRRLRVLVLGDAMLDTYLEGTAARLCSEGPVPVVSKTAEYRLPGGAANTAANLRALNADVCLLGLVGTDLAGGLLRAALQQRDISDRWLVGDETAQTLHKLRIIADGQYVVRFDEGPTTYTTESQQRLINTLEEVYPLCDLVVVSDYRYGVLSDALIERLQQLHEAQPKVLLIDSKALHRFSTLNATIVTPNLLEARVFTGIAEEEAFHLNNVEQIAQRMLSLLQTQHVAITLGAHGVLLLNRQSQSTHIPAHAVAHANDVGAGDSFASAMALALAAGGTIEESARIAIDATRIAVTRQRTAVVQYQELLQRVSLREYSTHTSIRNSYSHEETISAQNSLLQLVEYVDTEREIGHRIVFTNGVFDILHAGHVQFLRQAKALGHVLVVGINSDASTQRLKGVGRPINNERDRMALVAALDAVDAVVLFDEVTPTELIRILRPTIHVKGGDYADEALPEAEAVYEGGGQVVILPLVGTMSTSAVIDRIADLYASDVSQSRNGVSHD
ncbi:MAG: D-glycero-beta-D-manno-heptose-7-phosphate kinase [Ktedonobacteraceae bacterium]